jgi:hypothetical protein
VFDQFPRCNWHRGGRSSPNPVPETSCPASAGGTRSQPRAQRPRTPVFAANTETITAACATGSDSATAGRNYNSTSGTLTFAPGETSKSVTVQVNGDRLGEANEIFFVNLSGPTNATIADGQGVGTISDDEPRISIGDVSKKEGKKNQKTQFIFTVMLSAAYDQSVTVSFRTAGGTPKISDGDSIARTDTLTFAPAKRRRPSPSK